jgi:FecR protein
MTINKSDFLQAAKSAHQAQKAPPELDKTILALINNPENKRPYPDLWKPALALTFAIATIAFSFYFFTSQQKEKGSTNSLKNKAPATLHAKKSQPIIINNKLADKKPITVPNIKNSTNPPKTIFMVERKQINLVKSGKKSATLAVNEFVQARLTSSKALVIKNSEFDFSVISGSVTFHVKPIPPGKSFRVESNKNMVEVFGTVFTVSTFDSKSKVSLQSGKIRLTRSNGIITMMKPGDSISIEKPNTALVINTKTIRAKLEKFRKTGKHKAAAAYLLKVIPRVNLSLKSSLLFDLASIYGEHLHKWDKACKTLGKHKKLFPKSKFSNIVASLWLRYRCN